jgi:ubiquinone/menaquinone biosynthesis C-methylase UbiE/uncharacterized protein YbaR (Trm112 family)
MTTPRQLKTLYEEGKNINEHMRREKGIKQNTDEIIEISYDLQAGSYIAAMEDTAIAKHKNEYIGELARIIQSLCTPTSLLEAGVGEATTLASVLGHFKNEVRSFGFDLSWSRVACAKLWLKKQGQFHTTLCTGNLFHIPFADNSIDVVYTSHSIEPNGGNEEPILRELYRITKKFLILLEPGYELATQEARQRMDSHGYCKGLIGIAGALGYDVLEHRLFPFIANPLNPTALTIIKKDDSAELPLHVLACPKFKTPLKEIEGMLFSPEALVVYPVVGGIPCLRVENGIFASKYQEFMRTI